MGRKIDLTGNRFGRWLVIEEVEKRRGGNVCFLCKCDCGKEAVVSGAALRKGESKSCGCLQRESMKAMVGKRFGRLLVLGEAEERRGDRVCLLCKCDCGKETVVRAVFLKNGDTKSCGCLKREVVAKTKTTHGMCNTPEYNSWSSMKRRCTAITNDDYNSYGGRGIKVCDRWIDSFENFYEDMGPRPSRKHSLDRIDNNGDYSPNNCRWATPKEQANNRRSNVFLTLGPITDTITNWSRVTGIKYHTLKQRVNRDGWSDKKALLTPVRGVI